MQAIVKLNCKYELLVWGCAIYLHKQLKKRIIIFTASNLWNFPVYKQRTVEVKSSQG
ncbi:hypothetical protein CANARDRAFT_27117 [[Candida] arabinofermentans NRRL YB-2248]|uniref:Uncharacterized protein n=1 Tax=[Candida] arabinofermentans NRRL YB-2248 TaxID=983967 RepID=A0A1E4T4Q7_9ASCO|nr:hypothetical protein CANARDRAFT_27117 [[Candida] arabinofermentans NRRL YB-2248]